MLKYHPHRDNDKITDEGFTRIISLYINEYFPECKNILDLGMGSGKLVEMLNNNGKEAYGIDLRNLGQKNLIIADARQLPFKDDSFDLVIDSYMTCDMHELQKLPKPEIDMAIHEAIRVLAPDGGLICRPNANIYRKYFNKVLLYDGTEGVFKK